MKKKIKIISAVFAYTFMQSINCTASYAADDPNNTYTLEDKDIYAERDKTIVNPYITGGDFNIISRQDIENHHYSSIQDALKTIPGIQISTPGYRGGEYGYSSYNTELSINGENSIVILVDGRRMDNDANSYGGNKSRVNLSTLPGMDNVEQIDIIKGAGAAMYGSDAAGGVINIITRRGTIKPKTTINIATGSWQRHNYALTHTGASSDGSLKYALSLSRQLSGNAKYKDSFTGSTKSFENTGYREENASFNITKDFDKKHSLTVTYDHSYEKAYYPITAPDFRYIESFYNGTMASINPVTHRYIGLNSSANGYRNIFLYDAWLGSYDETQTNNADLKYVFDKTDENAESFIRVYKNYTRYNMKDFSDIWNVPYPYLDEFWNTARNSLNGHTDIEKAAGTAVQFSKHVKNHSMTTGFNYRKSSYEGWDNDDSYASVRRSYSLYLQDKIKLGNKFTITPGVNYSYYSSGHYNDTDFGSTGKTTFSIYSNYDFDTKTNIYFSASQIFRPVTGLDFSRAFSNDPLKDEKGYNYNLGVDRKITSKDQIGINYANTYMDNALGRYSILNTAKEKWETKAVNAERKKQALNISYTHAFSDIWKLSSSYSWVNENFHAKNVFLNPDGSTPDSLINAYRPRNIYRTSLTYEKKNWFGDLAYTIYSGNDTQYFTDSRFGVLDLALNYKLNESAQIYLNINNITNEAYQTRALSGYDAGALPESGRSFMLGVKYTF
ncbi:TonB-dependent receptor [Pectinatus haikarae]|uniref:Iron complex outermembrane receptor protein n=1 Tax=Pectinatus haikarae TaxID=349096 RepID=A0ABT9YA62_9FIRM|nr:TonB-dependent receptor [Pectinatus haikarae]MDQ0204730.1 iron complex outermembrane receptor protein [Pectinatus haikarae]